MLGAFILVGASACAAPEVATKERRGSSQSTLGKPKASIRTAASQETTDKYGITEWKMFRGKKDLFMTGYDADGAAVKGVSLAFGTSADDGVVLIPRQSVYPVTESDRRQLLTGNGDPATDTTFQGPVLPLLCGRKGCG